MKASATTDYDIVIVGSGPAGISTAMHLARRMPQIKDRLLVIEKAEHPRKKLCGGGITPDTDRWLTRLGVDLPIDTLRLCKTRLVFEGRVLGFAPIRTVCREEFDAALAQHAAASGLAISQGEQLLSFSVSEDGVFLSTDKRSLTTHVLVGADGSSSIVRRHVCRQSKTRPPIAICRTLRVMKQVKLANSPEHMNLEAVFDFRCCFQNGIQGYCWSFPIMLHGEPWLNLGISDFGTTGTQRLPLAPTFTQFLAQRGLTLKTRDLESHPIRWFHPDTLISAHRVLLVGDAAGIDPLFADGISCSLAYGHVAALAIERAIEDGDFSFSKYKDELQDHELGRFLSQRFGLALALYGDGRSDLVEAYLIPPATQKTHRSAPGALVGLTIGRHWWQYKVPPLLTIAYALIVQYRLPPAQSFGALAALLISVVFLAMQAHAINDAFDIEYDRRSGKPNAMAMLSPRWRALLYLLLGVAGLSPWLGIRLGAWPLVLLTLIVALPLIYAAPPMRLKERGVWGLVADAAYAHAIPSLFVIALFSQLAEVKTPGALLFTIAAGLWSFCFGLRGILIHQFEDLPNDVMAGVNTFVTTAGVERAHGMVSRVIFPAELAALGVVAIAVWTFAPVLIYILAGYTALFLLARATRVWPVIYDPAPRESGTPASLMGVYTVWAPVVLAALLAFSNWAFTPLLLLHVALFWKPVTREFAATARIVPGLSRALCSKFKWHVWVRLRKVPRKARAAWRNRLRQADTER